MDGDFDNPARQYRGFRPRQGASSGFIATAPVQNANHGLYNNSPNKYLVVRRVVCICVSAPVAVFEHLLRGAVSGIVTPIVAGEALIDGQHTYSDAGSPGTGNFLFTAPTQTGPSWNQDFPMAVLPPGWSLRVVDPTVAEAMSVSFFWEAVFPRELDFDW